VRTVDEVFVKLGYACSCRKVSVTGYKGSVVLTRDIENDVVVLFDNTFSWLHEKEVRLV
jgi:hypothetical protein